MRLGIHRCATGAASFALALVCCAIPSTTVHAALLAVDNASDAVYATWDPGDNGGTGWGGGWSFRSNTNAVITSTNGNRGWFVASSTNNDNVAGDTNADGDINTAGSKAWGLYSNTANTNEIYAVRPFSGALVVGQGVRMDFDNGNINTGAVVGVRLISDAGNVASREFEFRFVGGDSFYTAIGTPNKTSTLPFTREGIRVEFYLTSTSTYSLTATRLVDGAVYSTTGGTVSGAPITGLALRNQNAGSGGNFDGFFNSIAIVPEPSGMALILLAPLLSRRHRRNT